MAQRERERDDIKENDEKNKIDNHKSIINNYDKFISLMVMNDTRKKIE